MLKLTRQKFNQFLAQQAALNSLTADEVGSTKFNVDPTVSQTLELKLRESHAFLDNIAYEYPTEQMGEKLGLDTTGSIASTTDTTGAGKRQTSDVTSLDKDGYHCQQVNFDTHLRYAKLDAWAKFPNFQTMIQAAVIRQQAFDRLRIGFNGTSRAATSDRATNPLLQDVAIGWLEKLRANKNESVISGYKVGDGGDYQNIDSCVLDAHQELIAEWHQEADGMLVICGRRLLADKYLALTDGTDAPTERKALESIIVNKSLGGLPSITVPYFPANAFCVTTLSNLSIYVQDGSRRRHIKDVPESDRIEDFQSANMDFIVEDYDKMALIEGVQVPDGVGGWA